MATPKILEMAKHQGEHQKHTVAGATLVTKNARLLLQQEEIAHIKEIPNLPTHQRAANAQAKKWVDDIWPLIIQTTSEIIDYANTFQSTYTSLQELAPKLEKGDQKAKNDFVQLLEVVLIPAISGKAKTAKDIAIKIKKFHDAFQPLYTAFVTDFKEADRVLTADNQELTLKKMRLEECKKKIEIYEKTAAATGAAAPIIGAVTTAISETGIGALVGGILTVAAFATMITMLSLQAKETEKKFQLINEIAALKSEVAQLTLIEHQISGLQQYTLEVVDKSANVADGWVALEQALGNTVDHLKSITPEESAIIITVQLRSANKEWGVALEQAKVLQPKGGRIEVKKFDKPDDMVKAMKQQAMGA